MFKASYSEMLNFNNLSILKKYINRQSQPFQCLDAPKLNRIIFL